MRYCIKVRFFVAFSDNRQPQISRNSQVSDNPTRSMLDEYGGKERDGFVYFGFTGIGVYDASVNALNSETAQLPYQQIYRELTAGGVPVQIATTPEKTTGSQSSTVITNTDTGGKREKEQTGFKRSNILLRGVLIVFVIGALSLLADYAKAGGKRNR